MNKTLIIFIKSNIIGIASEAISAKEANTSVGKIIHALKHKCERSNSNLILGKMQRLRIVENNFVLFLNHLETLAKELIESLTIAGIPRHVANEISIKHTIKICREKSNFNQIKIILAGRTFKTIENVIAKFLLETIIHEREQKTIFRKNYNWSKKPNRYCGNDFYNNNNNNIIENKRDITVD